MRRGGRDAVPALRVAQGRAATFSRSPARPARPGFKSGNAPGGVVGADARLVRRGSRTPGPPTRRRGRGALQQLLDAGRDAAAAARDVTSYPSTATMKELAE